MNNRIVYVNASNCHVGGGKTLLNGFIKGLVGTTQTVIIYIDERFQLVSGVSNNIILVKVNKLNRFFVDFKIRKKATQNDEILYFGNLPPFLKFQTCNVYLLLSSRFYVDRISLEGFPVRDRVKIFLEKSYFKIFIRNVSGIIVQTSTMHRLLDHSGFKKQIYVWPFDDLGDLTMDYNLVQKKEPHSFLYVASLLPYKNHKRLLQAWKNLKDSGINPRLYLTLDENNVLSHWIEKYVGDNELNVVFLRNLPRDQIVKYYEKAEVLIYPSYFEAYGLPLIEAKKFQLKILASDVDYSWDFIVPDDFFNPYDVDSISRAVKRYLNRSHSLNKIYTPKEFVNSLLNINI